MKKLFEEMLPRNPVWLSEDVWYYLTKKGIQIYIEGRDTPIVIPLNGLAKIIKAYEIASPNS